MDVPNQATSRDMQAEEANTDAELWKSDRNTGIPTEGTKNVIVQSHFLLDSHPSCRHEVAVSKSCIFEKAQFGDIDVKKDLESRTDIHMDNYGTKDAWSSGKNDCDTSNEEEASLNMLDSSDSMLDAQALTENLCLPAAANATCEISGRSGVDFHTLNILDHATHVKVEPSDFMEEVPCSEIAAKIAPAALGMSELSCERESDVIDNVTLQQQYKLMLSNMNHILDCHFKLEHI